MKKNDLVELVITDLGTDGEGIGKTDGFTLFVKDSVPGDVIEARIVKLKKNYGYGRVERVLKPSPFRVKPSCDHARRCGGCQIMEIEYSKQLEFKHEKIRNNLVRIGGFNKEYIDSISEPIVGMEDTLRYRNKAQYPVGLDKDGNIITGFYAGRTHSIISSNDCKLCAEINESILAIIRGFMKEYDISPYDEEKHTGLVRHILIRDGRSTGEIMVCIVINGSSIPNHEVLCQRLSKIKGMTSISISINRDITNVIMGDNYRTIWGRDRITDVMKVGSDNAEGLLFSISPLSFYQVNPVQVEKLYGIAIDYADLNKDDEVWDLCCGIGTITLSMAAKCKMVHGIEIVPQAIEDAKDNAVKNKINNSEFICAAAEEYLPAHSDEIKADVIVMDPPRKGMDEEALKVVVGANPKRIVYVSCDSATLARDLKILCENGYELVKWRGVDMFSHSVHVETVVLMTRTK